MKTPEPRKGMPSPKLTRADFRDATVLECVDGFENLKGAVIDSSQAVELAVDLARALRITVEDR